MRTLLAPAPFGLLAVLLLPTAGAAQVMSPPERAADVIARTSGEQSRTTLNFTLGVTGGVDRNDLAEFEPTTDPDGPSVFDDSTNNGSIAAGLEFARTSGRRNFGAMVNGSTDLYGGNSATTGPSGRLLSAVNFGAPLGSASRFSAGQRFNYESLYSPAAFAPIEGDVPAGELPIDGPTQGIAELASYTSDTNLGLEHRLGRRNALNGSFGYVFRSFSGNNGNDRSMRASAAWSRQVTRFTSINASYAYSNGEFSPLLGGGGTRPLVGHSVESGFSHTKRLSPRRALQLNASVGAVRTDAVTGTDASSIQFWSPSASVSARIDLARTWALSANYSAGTSALSGLTTEAYRSDAFGGSIGGTVGRVAIVASTAAGRGTTGNGSEAPSDYSSLSGTFQVSLAITKRLSGMVQYNWYQYDISGDAAIPSSLPANYKRSAIRAGLSLELPIIGERESR
jgi:hypothetical protein